MHLSYLNEEKSPYRSILLRSLVEKFFDYTKPSVNKYFNFSSKFLFNTIITINYFSTSNSNPVETNSKTILMKRLIYSMQT